jgi:hypothetical protein
VQKYRFSALQGINSEDNFDLPGAIHTNDSDRATAVLAAIYALAFTSLHMGDPIGHFMVLVRGCSAVTRRIVEAGFTSPLFPQGEENLSVRPHMDVMRKRMGNAMPLPTEVIDAARESLRLVEEKCDFLPFEQDFLDRMKSVVAVTSGPIEGDWNPQIDLCCGNANKIGSVQPLHRTVEPPRRHVTRGIRTLQWLAAADFAGAPSSFPGSRDCGAALAASIWIVRERRQQTAEICSGAVSPGVYDCRCSSFYAVNLVAEDAAGTVCTIDRSRSTGSRFCLILSCFHG